MIYPASQSPLARPVGAPQAFEQALALHGRQRLPEAEGLCRATLKRDDRHFNALYQLGVLKLQQGQLAGSGNLVVVSAQSQSEFGRGSPLSRYCLRGAANFR